MSSFQSVGYNLSPTVYPKIEAVSNEKSSEDPSIDELENEWNIIAQGLPEEQASLLKRKLYQSIFDLQIECKRLNSINRDSVIIRTQINKLVEESRAGLSEFLTRMKISAHVRLEVANDHKAVTGIIHNTQLNLAPISLKSNNNPVSEEQKKKEDEGNPLIKFAKDRGKKIITKRITQTYGKPAALAVKLGAQILIGTPVDSENPTRDLIISSAVYVGVAEVMGLALSRSPAYAAIASSNILYDFSCRAQEGFAYLEEHQEIKESWNRQVLLSCEGAPYAETSIFIAKAAATVLKLPGTLIRNIQEKVTSLLCEHVDQLGVTEENIQHIVHTTAHILSRTNLSFLGVDSDFEHLPR